MAILTLPRCRSLFRAPLLLSESSLPPYTLDLWAKEPAICSHQGLPSVSFAFKIFSQGEPLHFLKRQRESANVPIDMTFIP